MVCSTSRFVLGALLAMSYALAGQAEARQPQQGVFQKIVFTLPSNWSELEFAIDDVDSGKVTPSQFVRGRRLVSIKTPKGGTLVRKGDTVEYTTPRLTAGKEYRINADAIKRGGPMVKSTPIRDFTAGTTTYRVNLK